MIVSELIEQLQKLPQDALVVKSGFDHSYEPLYTASDAKADLFKSHHSEYDEDFGEPLGEVVTVVVIS